MAFLQAAQKQVGVVAGDVPGAPGAARLVEGGAFLYGPPQTVSNRPDQTPGRRLACLAGESGPRVSPSQTNTTPQLHRTNKRYNLH